MEGVDQLMAALKECINNGALYSFVNPGLTEAAIMGQTRRATRVEKLVGMVLKMVAMVSLRGIINLQTVKAVLVEWK